MGLYGDPWLREARDTIKSYPDHSSAMNSWSRDDFEKLADAVEKAIKAALIESHGGIPQKHNHKKLVSLCQTTGVWDVLPPALKNLVQEVESYHSASSAGAPLSRPEQLHRCYSVARRLIDYVEYHVIGNNSVLKRLTVA